MEDSLIYIVTFLAALLTLLTGFGLGTILTPVFAIVYEVKLAILLVAIVHFLNNAFKLTLFWKDIDASIIRRFGILSILGAIAGAYLQVHLYSGAVKIFLGVVLIALGLGELLPTKRAFTFPKQIDRVGGFLSGFLGGLVGNQGAIRSAYLLNYKITKEAFIATATMIALFIDVTRIPIYLTSHNEAISQIPTKLVTVVVIAFGGTLLGKKMLHQVSNDLFKRIVAICVVLMGIFFIVGML